MDKNKTIFACIECEKEYARWQGKCSCGEFSSIVETNNKETPKALKNKGWAGNDSSNLKTAKEIKLSGSKTTRIDTKIAEFNRTLGSEEGLTKGSIVLIGGEPGVGKSTLLIQAMSNMSKIDKEKCLYVTGEESLSQVVSRGERLKLDLNEISFLSETNVETIIYKAKKSKISVLVVDSIQTIETEDSTSNAGSPSQLRESTAKLTAYAKQDDVSIILVGHVNKGGDIAGPKVLEHIVDTVLSFEGEEGSRYKMLRTTKNRFGQTNELGVFAMMEEGLKEVKNPSSLFLSSENKEAAGSAIMVSQEGTRPLLFELQSLVAESSLENPVLVPLGLNYQRIRMILAIMQKHIGIKMFNKDIYINIVGGIQLTSKETSYDLPVCFSLISSQEDLLISKSIASFGELSLSGEVRPVPNGEGRILEAQKHGFKHIIVPKANVSKQLNNKTTINIIAVTNIADAIKELRNLLKNKK